MGSFGAKGPLSTLPPVPPLSHLGPDQPLAQWQCPALLHTPCPLQLAGQGGWTEAIGTHLWLRHIFPCPQLAPEGTRPGSVWSSPRSTRAFLQGRTVFPFFKNVCDCVATFFIPNRSFSLRCEQCSIPHKTSSF